MENKLSLTAVCAGDIGLTLSDLRILVNSRWAKENMNYLQMSLAFGEWRTWHDKGQYYYHKEARQLICNDKPSTLFFKMTLLPTNETVCVFTV